MFIIVISFEKIIIIYLIGFSLIFLIFGVQNWPFSFQNYYPHPVTSVLKFIDFTMKISIHFNFF